jgi:hypothetical protein
MRGTTRAAGGTWSAAQDVPGAKAVYEELKTRFPVRRWKSGKTETKTES